MKMREILVVLGMVVASVLVSRPLRRRRLNNNRRRPPCPVCSGVGGESKPCFFCEEMVEVGM